MSRLAEPLRATPETVPGACLYVHLYIYWAVEFSWDSDKAAANLRKHGVDFADAVSVLYDRFAVTIADDVSDEERFVTVGMDGLGRIIVVVYTWRGECVRLISARRATRRERQQYEAGL